MKILCPVDSAVEAEELAALGASELYGGVVTPEWESRFTLAASANRRSFPEAQIGGVRELKSVVDAAHRGGARFFLTVNSPFYTAAQIAPLLEIVERSLEAGVDALIAADIGLIIAAGERWPGVPVHLSTMAEVTNSAAVRFYRSLGVERVTLPRHLSLAGIEAVLRGSPETAFDVFVLYGQCVNAEGLCTFSHDDPGRVWPCVQPYRVGATGRRVEGTGRAPAACAQMLWEGLPRGEACGLCAVHDLQRLGVEGLKIVGRGTSPARKRWAVKTAAHLLRLCEMEETAKEEFRREARRLYGERFPGGCRPTLCYYPELLPAADE